MLKENRHPADQIRDTMARIYNRRLTTGSGGNLSFADEAGRIWMTPTRIDKGGIDRDQVACYENGRLITKLSGTSEWMVNLKIHEVCPDLKALLHVHSAQMLSFVLAREIPDMKLVAPVAEMLGDCRQVGYYLPGSTELLKAVSDAFASGADLVFMDNHGIFLGSRIGLKDAYRRFEALDFMVRAQLYAEMRGGTVHSLTDGQMRAYSAARRVADAAFVAADCSACPVNELDVMDELVRIATRGYDNEIMNCMFSSLSARVAEHAFRITPNDTDMIALQAEDILRVENGTVFSDRQLPFRTDIHRAVYDANPRVNAVLVSIAPYAMSYAVSDLRPYLGIDPEYLLMVRNVKVAPFGTPAEEAAKLFDEDCTCVIIENECAILAETQTDRVLGRMEVLEYITKALCQMDATGRTLVKLTATDIAELEASVIVERAAKSAAE